MLVREGPTPLGAQSDGLTSIRGVLIVLRRLVIFAKLTNSRDFAGNGHIYRFGNAKWPKLQTISSLRDEALYRRK
jgi:hypothetical protein